MFYYLKIELTYPKLKKKPIENLREFNKIIKLNEETWIDWWVWRYFFSNEIDNTSEIETEDFGFNEKFSNKINYNYKLYETKEIKVNKNTLNTITFEYTNSYLAYRLICWYIYQPTIGETITIETNRKLHDAIDFYKLIKAKKKITLFLNEEDYKSLLHAVVKFI